MDGEGSFYRAMVTLAATKHCMYEIKEKMPQEKTWNGNICIAMAPTKMMDRTEWFAEKATEIGFDELSFLHCKFSERKTLRADRVEKIVISAAKQSRKSFLPLVHELTPFSQFIDESEVGHRYIAHCYDEIERVDFFNELNQLTDDDPITILVGPEGDFSIDEVNLAMAKGYKSISLGKSRLRTETAGLYAVMLAQLAKRK